MMVRKNLRNVKVSDHTSKKIAMLGLTAALCLGGVLLIPGSAMAEETSEGDMRVMFLLWDATSGNKSLKIVEIPIKTAPRALNNPDFPEK